VKHEEGREDEEVSIQNIDLSKVPSSTVDAEVMAMAVDPSNTNFVIDDFFTPPERNSENTVIRHTTESDAAITDAEGPVEDDQDTDATGATQAATTSNPGGYQIGREVEEVNTTGGVGRSTRSSIEENRRLPDGRWALIVIDANEAGTYELQVRTGENT
jgi:hypothetical protein